MNSSTVIMPSPRGSYFLKTSSVANLMNSSTVIMPSPLGSYFLNKVSKESSDGQQVRPCFLGVAHSWFIMSGNSDILITPSLSESWSVKISSMNQYNSTPSALLVLARAFLTKVLYWSTLPWSMMGWGSMVAVLAAMCSWQNFSHSSKVMTPVDLRSMESNIFCLAASFSASLLYNSLSSGA